MNSNNYTVFNALVDIIAAPAKALDEIRHRVAWLWVPLLISVLVTIAAFVSYFLWVDYPWLVEDMVRQMPPGSDAAAAEQFRSFMTPAFSITIVVISIPVMTLLIYAVQSIYLHLVNKVVGDPELRYGQWFAFSSWTAFVGVFQAIAMFVVMLMADSNQVAQHDLMPLSFNSLFVHAEPGTSWFTWGNSISLVNVWMLVLMTIGFMRWTGSSAMKSAIIVSAPWVLIFGLWALLIS